jgi:NAD(P)-dependent dehydrogenase (short-subunit alcohol dehydrogenase family)
MELDDAVMLITGAGTGIGAATAQAAHAAGARVVLAGRRFARVEAMARALSTNDPRRPALAIEADVTVADDADRLVADTLAAFGRIDVLVNNAGQGFYSPLAGTDMAPYRTIIEVNLLAPLRLMQAVIAPMQRQGGGVIVNVSSGASLGAYPTTAAYASTKAALNQLSAVARCELAPDGITVSTIYPYLTESDFNDALLGGDPILAPIEQPQHSAAHVATELIELIRTGNESSVLAPA